MYEVSELADLREKREDMVVYWIMTELFGDGPYCFGGEGFVEGDQVFCFHDGGTDWLFRDLCLARLGDRGRTICFPAVKHFLITAGW